MSEYLAMQDALRAAGAAARVVAQHWPELLLTHDYDERAIMQRFLSAFLPEEDLPAASR